MGRIGRSRLERRILCVLSASRVACVTAISVYVCVAARSRYPVLVITKIFHCAFLAFLCCLLASPLAPPCRGSPESFRPAEAAEHAARWLGLVVFPHPRAKSIHTLVGGEEHGGKHSDSRAALAFCRERP
jgi:hypothetical protein